jgi:hypothetical protein
MKHELTKVPQDSPDRCQSSDKTGQQCKNKALEGSKYCSLHSSASELKRIEVKKYQNYVVEVWKAQLEEKTESPDILSLRDEVALLRVLIETRLNTCLDSSDLLRHSHVLADLITKCTATVSTCHKIEKSMGALLSKQAILRFAEEIIQIITDNVTDPDTVTRIANEIADAFQSLGDYEPHYS